jgi:hypothetical protein
MLAGFVRAVMCILLSLSFALFLQIWDYGAARTHARILMQIGASAGHEDRRHVLMQCYDETVRYMWAEKARRGDEGFNVNIASLTLDLEALSSAKHLCDTQYPKSVKNTKGAERSSNKFSDRSFPHMVCTCLSCLRWNLGSELLTAVHRQEHWQWKGKGQAVVRKRPQETWSVAAAAAAACQAPEEVVLR